MAVTQRGLLRQLGFGATRRAAAEEVDEGEDDIDSVPPVAPAVQPAAPVA